jgi:hypothetical protein
MGDKGRNTLHYATHDGASRHRDLLWALRFVARLLLGFGVCLAAVGVAWFGLSCIGFALLIRIERTTGVTLDLPRVGSFEWGGLVLYFGLYFGSWAVFAVGVLLAAAAMCAWAFLPRPSSPGPCTSPPPPSAARDRT